MYDSDEVDKQIKDLRLFPEASRRRLGLYVPKWYEKRLPFHLDVSINIGSTMFDFSFWNLPEVLSIGVFWIHLDIHAGGRH